MPRIRDKIGLGVGPEVRWQSHEPKRKRRRRTERKWQPRPAVQSPPRPKPTTCAQITCPFLKVPVIPGRFVCVGCAEKLDRRAAELRERERRRTVADTSAPASVGADPGHDQGGTPDA